MDFAGSILDNIEEALIVTDYKAKILYFNKVAGAISASILRKQLQLGDNMVECVGAHRTQIVKNIYEDLRNIKLPTKSFAEYTTNLNETIYLEFKYIPVVNESGELSHVHTMFRDITHQKIFEKKLTNEVANIRSLIDKANAIIIGIDTRGYITDWNVHCEVITGFKKNEVYARKFSEVLLPQTGHHNFEELLIAILNREAFINYEMPVITRTGKQLTFLLSTSIRISPTGSVVGIVFVGQDLTELMEYRSSLERQVEERTVELQRVLHKEREVVEMKSRFVSVASHEFRTPLSSIEHAAGFLRAHKHLSPLELNLKLETIEKQIKHMTHLLDDVLTYGKSDAGKIKLVVSKVGIVEFIQKIIEDVGHTTKNTHIIKLNLSQSQVQITTDEKLFRNIIINLLTNAIKFSPGKKNVYLNIVANSDTLTMEVKDEGMGIAEDELSKIFEPFERSKRVESIQGTGLGLSIVKKAVELFGGTISVKSTVNIGTTVTVIIPIKND
jgi:PAS domain S-box-containing protein